MVNLLPLLLNLERWLRQMGETLNKSYQLQNPEYTNLKSLSCVIHNCLFLPTVTLHLLENENRKSQQFF